MKERALWLIGELADIVDPHGLGEWLAFSVLRRAILDLVLLDPVKQALWRDARCALSGGMAFVAVATAVGVTAPVLRNLRERYQLQASARRFFIDGEHRVWCNCLVLDPDVVRLALSGLGLLDYGQEVVL